MAGYVAVFAVLAVIIWAAWLDWRAYQDALKRKHELDTHFRTAFRGAEGGRD